MVIQDYHWLSAPVDLLLGKLPDKGLELHFVRGFSDHVEDLVLDAVPDRAEQREAVAAPAAQWDPHVDVFVEPRGRLATPADKGG